MLNSEQHTYVIADTGTGRLMQLHQRTRQYGRPRQDSVGMETLILCVSGMGRLQTFNPSILKSIACNVTLALA